MQVKNRAVIVMALIGSACCVQAGAFKDGPHFGYSRGGDVREKDTAFGWQVAYEWSPYVSTELSITRQRDVIDFELVPPPLLSTFRLETIALALSGRAGHRFGRVHVYGAGGAGYYFLRAKSRNIRQSIAENPGALPPGVLNLDLGADVDDAFGYHLALGLEFVLAGNWEVIAEYRWVYLDTDVTFRRTETRSDPNPETPPIQRHTTSTKADLEYDHGLFRIGVNYRF